MKDLYITRHGQTEWNIERRLQGRSNSPLTEKGIWDAKQLAKRLREIPIDRVYTSDLLRAIQTADILIGKREIPRTILPELQEMWMGRWEGQLLSDMEDTDLIQYQNFILGSCEFAAPGGENIAQVRDRAEQALEILKNDPADTILVVTHGMLQSQLLEILNDRPFGNPTRVLVGTALSHYAFDGTHFTEKRTGCTAHLEVSESPHIR